MCWVSDEVHAYPSEFISQQLVEELISTHNLSIEKAKRYIRAEACNAEDGIYLGPLHDGSRFC